MGEERNETCRRVRERQKNRMRKERNIKIAVTLAIILVVVIGIICAVIAATTNKKRTVDKKNGADVQTEGKIKKKKVQTPSDADRSDKFKKIKYAKKSSDYTDILSPDVLSPYVALLDVNSNEIIAGKSVDARINPASMTKVMTLIVAVDNIKDFNQTFTMTADIIDPLYRQSASRAGFDPDEVITAKDMLYGLILPSGADASVGLATMIAGSEENFVKLMNDKCSEIGLKNTHFMNTSGLYDENHYTTPLEMAMILEYAMTNDTCREVLSTYQYTTSATPQHPEGILLSSTMFSRMYGNEVPTVNIVAGKTGYTVEAGNCLVSYAERGNDKYVVVTAGASNRWHVIYDDFQIYGNFIPNPPGYVKQ